MKDKRIGIYIREQGTRSRVKSSLTNDRKFQKANRLGNFGDQKPQAVLCFRTLSGTLVRSETLVSYTLSLMPDGKSSWTSTGSVENRAGKIDGLDGSRVCSLRRRVDPSHWWKRQGRGGR